MSATPKHRPAGAWHVRLEQPGPGQQRSPRPPAGLANDGNPATFWQAEAADAAPWLRIDLERFVAVSGTKLTFPTDGNWRYKVEISDDGDSGWKLIADQTQAAAAGKERTDAVQGTRPRALLPRERYRHAGREIRRTRGGGSLRDRDAMSMAAYLRTLGADLIHIGTRATGRLRFSRSLAGRTPATRPPATGVRVRRGPLLPEVRRHPLAGHAGAGGPAAVLA